LPVSGNNKHPNLIKKRKTNWQRYFFVRLTYRMISGYRIAQILSTNRYADNPTLLASEVYAEMAHLPLWSEISDFTPCTHARSNLLHIKYAEKTDN